MEKTAQSYHFLEHTESLCPHCRQRIDAKIILRDQQIFVRKWCPIHGVQEELLEEHADY